MERKESLARLVELRLIKVEPEIRRRLVEATDVVVFGSYASGLEGQQSDLDVFAVGYSSLHYKTKEIEILILPEDKAYSALWLGSELANHIRAFGVPLDQIPDWFELAKIADTEPERKLKRIRAYLRSLQLRWNDLSIKARKRYETKIRREVQRLQLLQLNLPTPPTMVLDEEYAHLTRSQRLALLAAVLPSDSESLLYLYPSLAN